MDWTTMKGNYWKHNAHTEFSGSYVQELPADATQHRVASSDFGVCSFWFHDGHWYAPRGGGRVKVGTPNPQPPVPQKVAEYPDGNPKSAQGAKKYSLRYLPLPANIEVNRAFQNGAEKYGAANWREKGVAASVYIDAALRHLYQWFDGSQERAEDSGVHNLGHAMACLAIIIDAQANGTLQDDRPFACKDTDALLKREEKKDEAAV